MILAGLGYPIKIKNIWNLFCRLIIFNLAYKTKTLSITNFYIAGCPKHSDWWSSNPVQVIMLNSGWVLFVFLFMFSKNTNSLWKIVNFCFFENQNIHYSNI